MQQANVLLKVLLAIMLLGVGMYTIQAFQTDGADLFSIFIQQVFALGWPGQFNLDFSCYLILSALWILWRNEFRPLAYLLALAAMVGGILFFASYLLVLLQKHNGRVVKILLPKKMHARFD
jgi:NADH:ubiquinone oxidoreductase subunit 2 (subunit N)